MGFLRNLFGAKVSPATQTVMTATGITPPPLPSLPSPVSSSLSAPDFVECTDRGFYEILETYQNRTRPLHDFVTWEMEEEARLKQRRVEAYQLRNDTDYKPH